MVWRSFVTNVLQNCVSSLVYSVYSGDQSPSSSLHSFYITQQMLPTSTSDVNELSNTPIPTVSKSADCPLQLAPSEDCVICLERISEKAAALPCHHDQFDFLCLGTWIQQRRICPLCKCEVTAIQYGYTEDHETTPKIFQLPPPSPEHQSRAAVADSHLIHTARERRQDRARNHVYSRGHGQDAHRHRSYGSRPLRRDDRPRPHQSQQTLSALHKDDTALSFRRHVYQHQRYSLHVGTNRISKYRNITPRSFQSSAHLVSRARTFLRRELAVFDFLNPSSSSTSDVPSTPTDRRRHDNAEFLLEYIVSILKTVDLKASTGQAEDLITDFLGRRNARLFLHELEAWLRSPYERLADWDRHVQYQAVGV